MEVKTALILQISDQAYCNDGETNSSQTRIKYAKTHKQKLNEYNSHRTSLTSEILESEYRTDMYQV